MEQMLAQINRRDDSRLRVELNAKLDLVSGLKSCILNDISRTGARIELPNPPRAGECGVLMIADIKAFGMIVWRSKIGCGLRFDHSLHESALIKLQQTGEEFAEIGHAAQSEFAQKLA